MQKSFIVVPGLFLLLLSTPPRQYYPAQEGSATPVQGTAPSVAVGGYNIYMTYVSGDSILFCFSRDQGKSFSGPQVVAVLPNLASVGGRGPQIISVGDRLVIAAADAAGDIHSYLKSNLAAPWKQGKLINDVRGVAREGFVTLASDDQQRVFAVWLDLRGDEKNKIFGARSSDAGISWSTNKLIYRSPDSTVCACCKPSVAMMDRQIAVMFRNWLHGNRDLYLVQSHDGGTSFAKAQKLGVESWHLNACPMDGGGLAIGNDFAIQAVWRRKDTVYRCEPGKPEIPVGRGIQCVIAGTGSQRFIAYVRDGRIFCLKPEGSPVELGSGTRPVVKLVGGSAAFVAWESGGQIRYTVLHG